MNYLELIQEVALHKGLDVPSSFSATSEEDYVEIKNKLNLVLRGLFLNNQFKFRDKQTTFSTVASTKAYSELTNRIISKEGLFIEDETDPLPYSKEDKYFVNSTDEGKPQLWAIVNQQICFYPIPDAVYTITINYNTLLSAKSSAGVEQRSLTLEDDEPNFPDAFHDVLVYGTLLQMTRNNTVDFNNYSVQYKSFLSAVLSESRGSRDNRTSIKSNIGRSYNYSNMIGRIRG